MTTNTKVLPPAPMPATAVYPVNATFNQLIAYNEQSAQSSVLTANTNAAADYMSGPWATFLENYEAGRLPWNAAPPTPPVSQWALVVETVEDNGALGFNYAPIPDPNGSLVCAVPAYTKIPPPQAPGTGVIAVPVVAANPTIPTGPVGTISTASDGSKWVRIG